MPTTTIAFGTYTNIVSTTKSGTDPVLEVIASADDNDYVYDATNGTHTGIAQFTLGDMPADFIKMTGLKVRLRYAWGFGTHVNTWTSLLVAVAKGDLTALADTMTVASNITTSYLTNSPEITFTGLNNSATKADWDGAIARIAFNITQNGGGDTTAKIVSAAELIATYAVAHTNTGAVVGPGAAVAGTAARSGKQRNVLPTLALGAVSLAANTYKQGSDPVLEPLATADDTDYLYCLGTEASGTYWGMFELDAMPADFLAMQAIQVRLRYAIQPGTRVSTWDAIGVIVWDPIGVDYLANDTIVVQPGGSGIVNTTPAVSPVITMPVAQSGADKDKWDRAIVYVAMIQTKVSSGDALRRCVFAAELTGTYTVARATSGALAGPGAAVAGTAAHIAIHPAPGALPGGNAAIAGTVHHMAIHAATGALAAAGCVVAGTAVYNAKHPSSSALAPGAGVVVGASKITRTHLTSGVLTAQHTLIVEGTSARGMAGNRTPAVHYSKITPTDAFATTEDASYPADNAMLENIRRQWRSTSLADCDFVLTVPSGIVKAVLVNDVNFPRAGLYVYRGGWVYLDAMVTHRDKLTGRRRGIYVLNYNFAITQIGLHLSGSSTDGAAYWRIGAAYAFAASTALPGKPIIGSSSSSEVCALPIKRADDIPGALAYGEQILTLDMPYVDAQADDGFECLRRAMEGTVGVDLAMSGYPELMIPARFYAEEQTESIAQPRETTYTISLREVV